jgi:PST family polysaccharide transporter
VRVTHEAKFLNPVANAYRWSVSAELASRIVQALAFVALARWLAPADFGIFAAALMVISFSQVFGEGGMAKALVQCRADVESAANAAFWMNVGFGVVTAAILFAAAPIIATTIFRDVRVGPVLQVLTLQIVLASLASVQTALLQKAMNFGRLFWLRLTTAVVPVFVSILLALEGYSYWALVGGVLTGQLVQVILLWGIASWRPSLTFDRAIATDLLEFGRWVVLTGLLTWFFVWADSFIVGVYLGADDLGIYQTGSQLVTMAYGLLFAPLLPVLYSHLSARDRDGIRTTLEKVLRILAPLSFSLAFILAAGGQLIELSLFGNKWMGLGQVLAILGIVQGIAWTVGANGEAYRALNKPEYETYIMGISSVLYLPAYVIAISFGFEAFLWTRLALVLVGLFLQQYFCAQIVGLGFAMSWLQILRGVAIGACGGLVYLVIDHLPLGVPNIVLFLLGLAGALCAIAGVWYVVDRTALRELSHYTSFGRR